MSICLCMGLATARSLRPQGVPTGHATGPDMVLTGQRVSEATSAALV